MRLNLIKVKPPQVAWLLLAVSVGLHFALPAEYRLDFACRACGILAFALGFIMMMWAWWLFRRSSTAIRPADQASSLITGGPFRFSRNPMYTGMVAMLLGVAVWLGSWPMLIAPVGFFVCMSRVFIPYEEQRLRDTFGEAYTAYARKVRRWM